MNVVILILGNFKNINQHTNTHSTTSITHLIRMMIDITVIIMLQATVNDISPESKCFIWSSLSHLTTMFLTVVCLQCSALRGRLLLKLIDKKTRNFKGCIAAKQLTVHVNIAYRYFYVYLTGGGVPLVAMQFTGKHHIKLTTPLYIFRIALSLKIQVLPSSLLSFTDGLRINEWPCT